MTPGPEISAVAGGCILLVDLPKFAAAHNVAWAELKDAVRLGTLPGYQTADGICYFLIADLDAWWDKRELQRKWLQ